MAYVVIQEFGETEGHIVERLDDVSTKWSPNEDTPGNRADLYDSLNRGLRGWVKRDGEWSTDAPAGISFWKA